MPPLLSFWAPALILAIIEEETGVTPSPGTELDAGQPRMQEGRRGLGGVDAHRQIDAPVAHDRDQEIDRHYTGRGNLLAQSGGNLGAIGPLRDGALLLSKSAGKGHWEIHAGDELVYVLKGAWKSSKRLAASPNRRLSRQLTGRTLI